MLELACFYSYIKQKAEISGGVLNWIAGKPPKRQAHISQGDNVIFIDNRCCCDCMNTRPVEKTQFVEFPFVSLRKSQQTQYLYVRAQPTEGKT